MFPLRGKTAFSLYPIQKEVQSCCRSLKHCSRGCRRMMPVQNVLGEEHGTPATVSRAALYKACSWEAKTPWAHDLWQRSLVLSSIGTLLSLGTCMVRLHFPDFFEWDAITHVIEFCTMEWEQRQCVQHIGPLSWTLRYPHAWCPCFPHLPKGAKSEDLKEGRGTAWKELWSLHICME